MPSKIKAAPRETSFRKLLRQLRIATIFGLTALAAHCGIGDFSHRADAQTVIARAP